MADAPHSSPSDTAPEAPSPLVFIDADGHVLEPPADMARYAEPEYADRVWRVSTREDGTEWITLDDMEMRAEVMALAAAGGFDAETRVRSHSGEGVNDNRRSDS